MAPIAQVHHAHRTYRAVRIAHLSDFLARCERLGNADTLPFQSPVWLRAWYETLGQRPGCTPVLLAIQDSHTGHDIALLPLVSERHQNLSVVTFADAGVVDYHMPLIARHWHQGHPETVAATALWQAAKAALEGEDVFLAHKMLAHDVRADANTLTTVTNPLTLALPLHKSPMFGNVLSAHDGWAAWRHSLDKSVRMEIERCWRLFDRIPEARFEQLHDIPAALAALDVLESQQLARMQALQKPYVLDQAPYRDFHRRLMIAGTPTGQTVLTTLRIGEDIVSVLFGVASQRHYIALRQSMGGSTWKHLSPGRLLHEGTARHMHEQGHAHLDFGIGDYHHKTALKLTPVPLYETCVALSWAGRAWALGWHTRHRLRQSPAARAAWHRWQQK